MCVVANADTGNRPVGIQSLETAVGGRPKNVVDDTFRSRKFEVTAVAYVECLIAKAKTTDPYHLDNRDRVGAKDNVGCQINRGGVLGKFSSFPVHPVSDEEACRFAKWVHNGQGDGDPEAGTYALEGYNNEGGGPDPASSGCKRVRAHRG